jgi:putative flippase GtrA
MICFLQFVLPFKIFRPEIVLLNLQYMIFSRTWLILKDSKYLNLSANNRFIRYVFVGFINTVFGYSLFAFLIYLHLHYVLASLLATILGVLFNFKTIGRIVFKSCNNTLIKKFFGVYAFTYMLNIGGLRVFSLYHVNMYVAGLMLLVLITPVSFLLNRCFVFKNI